MAIIETRVRPYVAAAAAVSWECEYAVKTLFVYGTLYASTDALRRARWWRTTDPAPPTAEALRPGWYRTGDRTVFRRF